MTSPFTIHQQSTSVTNAADPLHSVNLRKVRRTMTDDEISELDPVTHQYPFLTCASREESDVSTIYVLLSRNPSLLEKYIEQTTDEFAKEEKK